MTVVVFILLQQCNAENGELKHYGF